MIPGSGAPVVAWLTAAIVVLGHPPCSVAWGARGHALVVRAATNASEELPQWFRTAEASLVELANAPDRWRREVESLPSLAARDPDHFFALDDWTDEPLPADRWAFVRRAQQRHVLPDKIGLLPYALLEQYGILRSAFRAARAGRPGGREEALVAAGVVAHLAGDAAVPLHATRHHHGWVGPNPRRFTRDPGVHHWFETELVARIDVASLTLGAEAGTPLPDVAAAVRAALSDSLARVPDLYALERSRTSEGGVARARELTRQRLVVGATLVARVWQTAWVESGGQRKPR